MRIANPLGSRGMGINLRKRSGMSKRTGGSFGAEMRRQAGTIGFFIALIWCVWLIDAFLVRGALAQHGVVRRTVRGLPGILWAPFLHASWSHVTSNSLGILVLGGLLILRSEEA